MSKAVKSIRSLRQSIPGCLPHPRSGLVRYAVPQRTNTVTTRDGHSPSRSEHAHRVSEQWRDVISTGKGPSSPGTFSNTVGKHPILTQLYIHSNAKSSQHDVKFHFTLNKLSKIFLKHYCVWTDFCFVFQQSCLPCLCYEKRTFKSTWVPSSRAHLSKSSWRLLYN